MALIRFNPATEVMNLQREVNRFVDSFFPVRQGDTEDGPASAVWRPVVDIHEDENTYFIDVELPGMTKSDVKIGYQDGVLTLSGERRYEHEQKAETPQVGDGTGNGNEGASGNGNGSGTGSGKLAQKAPSCHRMERFYGRFYRSFSFPTAVNPDLINARFENGILKVTVPKAEQVKPRQIEIS